MTLEPLNLVWQDLWGKGEGAAAAAASKDIHNKSYWLKLLLHFFISLPPVFGFIGDVLVFGFWHKVRRLFFVYCLSSGFQILLVRRTKSWTGQTHWFTFYASVRWIIKNNERKNNRKNSTKTVWNKRGREAKFPVAMSHCNLEYGDVEQPVVESQETQSLQSAGTFHSQADELWNVAVSTVETLP